MEEVERLWREIETTLLSAGQIETAAIIGAGVGLMSLQKNEISRLKDNLTVANETIGLQHEEIERLQSELELMTGACQVARYERDTYKAELEKARAEVEEETIEHCLDLCDGVQFGPDIKVLIDSMPRKYRPAEMESVSDSTNEQDKE